MFPGLLKNPICYVLSFSKCLPDTQRPESKIYLCEQCHVTLLYLHVLDPLIVKLQNRKESQLLNLW